MMPFVEKNKFLAYLVGILGVGAVGGGIAGTPSTLDRVFGHHGPQVAVHVAGHVQHPGLYHLDPQARVDDAIKSAGGPDGEADVNQLNLASPVHDGEQIVVPAQGESVVAPVESPATTRTKRASSRGSTHSKSPVGQVSINNATLEELDQLPGVGPATAQKIIDYRTANGGFRSVEEIQRVKGIGPAKYAKMAPYLAP